jgi:hypothetical protein
MNKIHYFEKEKSRFETQSQSVAAIATTQDEFGKRIYKLEHKSGKFGR